MSFRASRGAGSSWHSCCWDKPFGRGLSTKGADRSRVTAPVIVTNRPEVPHAGHRAVLLPRGAGRPRPGPLPGRGTLLRVKLSGRQNRPRAGKACRVLANEG